MGRYPFEILAIMGVLGLFLGLWLALKIARFRLVRSGYYERRLGLKAEAHAIRLLKKNGYKILEENPRFTHNLVVNGEPETFDILLRNFYTVWLKAAPEEHMARVRAQGDTRPMAGNPAAMEELKSILTSREALYARAGLHIETSGRTPQDCLAEVMDKLKGLGRPAG